MIHSFIHLTNIYWLSAHCLFITMLGIGHRKVPPWPVLFGPADDVGNSQSWIEWTKLSLWKHGQTKVILGHRKEEKRQLQQAVLYRGSTSPELVSIKLGRSDQISRSVVSDSATPWIAACQASLCITNSRSSLKLTSIESAMPSSRLILCRPLLLLPPNPPKY